MADTTGNPQSTDVLKFLYVAQEDLAEAAEAVQSLSRLLGPTLDVHDSSIVQRALNLAIVVSYGRVFTQTPGHGDLATIRDQLLISLSPDPGQWWDRRRKAYIQ